MNTSQLTTSIGSVLNPDKFEKEKWADKLRSHEPERAKEIFIAKLREDEKRTNPETDLIGLRKRLFDDTPDENRKTSPEQAVENEYTGVYGVSQRFEDGIDWFYNPTKDTDECDFTEEWQWQFNRHYHWVGLADAYEETGKARYAQAFEDELRSWISQCPRPTDDGNYYPSAWRTIEAGIRTGWVWPYVFETFRRSKHVSDEALWLWVCSFREHGYHLLHHVQGQNWKTMESNGLAHIGAMFPELDGGDTFLSTGVDRTIAEIERQFYPDGLQTELAPSYAGVSITNTYSALEVAAARGETISIPKRSQERFKEIAEGYARLAAPNGKTLPKHDSGNTDARPIFEEFVGKEQEPWKSNDSDLLRWGGFGILRNEERYSLLDAGPYGTAHQHQDTLQVVAFKDNKWLLVDPGSPQYTDTEETHHIRSSAGHNVVLLDGQRHKIRPEILKTDKPLPIAHNERVPLAATAAMRSFETEQGILFSHERLLCDVENVGWVVFDQLWPHDEKNHTFEWIWQSTGEWRTVSNGAIAERTGESILHVEPTSTVDWASSIVSASKNPYRGWQPTGEDGEPGPVPTLRFETDEATNVEMITLLSPSGASVTNSTFEDDVSKVEFSTNGSLVTLSVRKSQEGVFESVTSSDLPVGDAVVLDDHTFVTKNKSK